jgi:hypothetical protein
MTFIKDITFLLAGLTIVGIIVGVIIQYGFFLGMAVVALVLTVCSPFIIKHIKDL